MSELCQPTDAELRALCASATGPSHLESLLPLANYRDIVALRRKLHEFPELANREHRTAATLHEELGAPARPGLGTSWPSSSWPLALQRAGIARAALRA